MPLTIQLHHSQRQTAFNLERWRELLGDRDLARLPHRIETDRHGHILMSPPPAPSHGIKQGKIATLFDRVLPEGVVVTGCPVSTSDGVKAIDIAWLAPERRQEVDSAVCLARAPEICVEILSPSNTPEEISENAFGKPSCFDMVFSEHLTGTLRDAQPIHQHLPDVVVSRVDGRVGPFGGVGRVVESGRGK
jgi:hypothetical protein